MSDNDTAQTRLIKALAQAKHYPHKVNKQIQSIQTHISTVMLTGKYAYKIKKPVDFGFLNFVDLAQRKHFCEEEIRLNRRLAPQIYLDVVAFSGDPDKPTFDGQGEVFEYAVKMVQFDQEGLLDKVLARGELSPQMIEQIAQRMVTFHEQAAVAGPDTPYGSVEAVFAPMQQNFDQLRPLLQDPQALAQLERLEHWTQARKETLSALLAQRKYNGHIRECHGDMHLGNMTLIKDEVVIFDGIEFNDYFRWIDVMSELAFLSMDLDDRGAHALSRRVINAYLQASGDYEGLALLRFYQVYRAMVRAKVASLRLSQDGLSDEERQTILKAYQSYANLAEDYTRPSQAALMITHGFSGSGKSTAALKLVEELGAVCVRSDIERKRLHGLAPTQSSQSALGEGLYSAQTTEQTYARALELALQITQAGYPAIVDATFLKKAQRERYAVTAFEHKLAFIILDIRLDELALRRRVEQRQKQGGDASEADVSVLENQLTHHDPLTREENAIGIDADGRLPIDTLRERLKLR